MNGMFRTWFVSSALGWITATAGCGPSQEEFDAERAKARELQAQLNDAKKNNAQLEDRLDKVSARNASMASRLEALGENVEELEGERSNLQRALQELRERERQSQARLETFRGLIAKFKSMIESGRLRVRIVRNRMVVELPEGVLFDSARAQIKDQGQTTLTQVSQVLKEIPNREFQIAGHTDNVPIRTRRFASNWELSAARAVTVARFLVEQGIAANRISAAGYADTQPVAKNDDKKGRAQNRRIEIVLVPNLDELPDLSSLKESS